MGSYYFCFVNWTIETETSVPSWLITDNSIGSLTDLTSLSTQRHWIRKRKKEKKEMAKKYVRNQAAQGRHGIGLKIQMEGKTWCGLYYIMFYTTLCFILYYVLYLSYHVVYNEIIIYIEYCNTMLIINEYTCVGWNTILNFLNCVFYGLMNFHKTIFHWYIRTLEKSAILISWDCLLEGMCPIQ